MRRRLVPCLIVAGLALVTPVAVLAGPQNPIIPPPAILSSFPVTAQTGDNSDPIDPNDYLDLGTDAAGLSNHKCVAGSASGKSAYVEYDDATGQPTFRFTVSVAWSWDCKKVTKFTRTITPTIYQPQYSYVGLLKDTTGPLGHSALTSDAQGRFGICETVAGATQCFLERDPDITWTVYANGKAKSTETP